MPGRERCAYERDNIEGRRKEQRKPEAETIPRCDARSRDNPRQRQNRTDVADGRPSGDARSREIPRAEKNTQ